MFCRHNTVGVVRTRQATADSCNSRSPDSGAVRGLNDYSFRLLKHMKIILLSTFCHKPGSAVLSMPRLGACVLVFMLLVMAGSMWAGYEMASRTLDPEERQHGVADALREMLENQRRDLDETRQQTRNHLDALALRLGLMQSHIMRLDALGEQLVRAGELDAEEFDFTEAPALGGADASDGASSVEVSELINEMEQLAKSIEDREHKLTLIEALILNQKVDSVLLPAGRPVSKGWISSPYGKRKDPFTGKKAFHHGVDIAGKKGSEVFAVAAGVVTEARKKSGYGYLVEIRHADGYITRYAHNSEIRVKTGDLVDKGQVIGLMGSSGRSTGPHVHFEIVRNGKSINPAKYLRRRG